MEKGRHGSYHAQKFSRKYVDMTPGAWFSGEHGVGLAVGLYGLFQPKQLYDSFSGAT